MSAARPRVGAHLVLSACFLAIYLFLNLPAIIIVSKLGFTAWYPATGLVLVLMLSFSPRYAPLAMLADVSASKIIYHQAVWSWQTAGVIGGIACYALAAHVLRGPLKINQRLPTRVDVLRYVMVTLAAACAATAVGVSSLAADGVIAQGDFWSAVATWFAGDATGLLGFAPFLMLYVVPLADRYLLSDDGRKFREAVGFQKLPPNSELIEFGFQIAAIGLTLWFVFDGPLASKQLLYLAYLPIIWVAMRQGVRRVVSALVIFNFGIVVALRVSPVLPEVAAKVGFLMLVISMVGLIVGSTVTERNRIGDELSERTAYLDSLIENTPMGIVVYDSEGGVQLCNDAFEALFQFSRGELIGNKIDLFIVPPDKQLEHRQLLAELVAGKRVQRALQRKRKDEAYVDVELYAVPLVLGGQVSGSIAIYSDVTDRVRVAARMKDNAEALKRSLSELEARTYQTTLLNEMGDLLQSCETSAEAIAVVSEFGPKLFPATTVGELYLFKSSRNALDREGQWGNATANDPAFAPSACWALRKGQAHWSEVPHGNIVCSHIRPNGSPVHLCVPMIARGETLGILHLQHDASINAEDDWRQGQKLLSGSVATQVALSLASLRSRETLRDQSIRDPLTGLFNRRFMQESLDREVLRAGRKGRPVAIIYLDIDHFKRFNDMFGHDAGDSVLRSMADLMRGFFRGDDVICRFGGEEFAVILPESSEMDAATRMKDFCTRVRRMVVVHHGRTLDSVTVSAGVAAFPKHGSSIEALLQAADQALYHSKTSGRDQVTVAF